MLREKIDLIVRQRMRAMEVWQQFESGERQHEPLPDFKRIAAAEAAADQAGAPVFGEADAVAQPSAPDGDTSADGQEPPTAAA